MIRRDRVALGLGALAAVVATLIGIVHTLDDRMLHPDVVAGHAVQTLTVRSVLNAMNAPTDANVRDAFAAAAQPPPEDSFVRTRRALVASAADPAVQAAVRQSLIEQHAALLAGRVPSELAFDTTPRRAPFIAGYGPEAEYRTILADHLDLDPHIRFGHGRWVEAASLTMRAADAMVPVIDVLIGLLVAAVVSVILLAETRRAGLRRAGIALLAGAGVLYLLFDGLVTIFFRATRSVEAEVAGHLYQSMVPAWSGPAAAMAIVGAVLVGASLATRRWR
jgi:hypothetical protein